ncbi:MAG: DUF1553 domain-containing protein [Pedosphaera sp.]|nr:DUF1553 domain-containing protein [Pedosphaera sp.]
MSWIDWLRFPLMAGLLATALLPTEATPANKAALERHFDRFLARKLARCTTCHLPSEAKNPKNLADFPHNPFGARLRQVGDEVRQSGKALDLDDRLNRIASEDADVDGVDNRTELLLGHNPGDKDDVPDPTELGGAAGRLNAFEQFLAGYRWRPFEPVRRPPVPVVAPAPGGFERRNPIDDFLAAEWAQRRLKPRPIAPRDVLLRRVYQDLIGLNPDPGEQAAFLADNSATAWETVVDRLLDDPRYGERWARHWMDVWRYSDWAGWADGNQVRDSKPHIWRWRDWIVESLNADLPYDRMVTEMLAADEQSPADPNALRATGFLVRNYKMLSREQWLEDTVKHTAQAFLGLTAGCAKCHDHMYDPISQREYYALRAIFEPHQVRTDRIPGHVEVARDGLVRAFDSTNTPTWLFVRGDERNPLTNEVITAGVPEALGGKLEIEEVILPPAAQYPDDREFVRDDLLAMSARAIATAQTAAAEQASSTHATPEKRVEAALLLDLIEKQHRVLSEQIGRERSLGAIATSTVTPDNGATNLVLLQRTVSVADALLRLHQARVATGADPAKAPADARKKLEDANRAHTEAVNTLANPLNAQFQARTRDTYPSHSTGRRLAFAKWLTSPENPLTARVAVNQIWLRHFGRGLVPTVSDFGRNGRPPSNPQLLDWLAAELMAPGTSPSSDSRGARGPAAVLTRGAWRMKHLHRLIVTSAAYRLASTPSEDNLKLDPDNIFLWRMSSHRLEAESIRDNLLGVAGNLDSTRGGPEIDHQLALTSTRRSLYLRHAAEKQAEFLQIFDGPSVTECYERHPSVMPQQALALANSELALRQARLLARRLQASFEADPDRAVGDAFRYVLARSPTAGELRECHCFLESQSQPVSPEAGRSNRALENLALVLFNHNDFVTVR